MNFLKRIMMLSIIMGLLSGCVNPLPKDVGITEFVTVTGFTTLTKDYVGTQFRVQPNATLDLGGHTINGTKGNGAILCVKLATNATVQNGSIVGCALAVAFDSNIADVTRKPLETMSKQDGLVFVEQLRAQANKTQRALNLVFSYNTTDVYVTNYTTGGLIKNVTSDRARKMSIYVDAYSKGLEVMASAFTNCGTHRSKSCIMIDGSSDNLIHDNIFYSTPKAVELYKNCGEANVPRWEGANDNRISDNSFNNVVVGVNVSSRKHDRFTSCRADDEGDIVLGTQVHGNTYVDVVNPEVWN